MQVNFTPDGLVNVSLTYDELVMLLIVFTNNVSPSSLLEKAEDERREREGGDGHADQTQTVYSADESGKD